MLRGLTAVAYLADDLEAAAKWYSELLGTEPYFKRREYIEFRIGDYQHELGILDRRYLGELGGPQSSAAGSAGVIAYWHVDDVPATFDRLLSMGAKPHQPPRHFSEGFVGASVVEPSATSWASCATRTTWTSSGASRPSSCRRSRPS